MLPQVQNSPQSPQMHFLCPSKPSMVDPLKVQAILDLPSPKTRHQLQSLQGKDNFLRRFEPEHATKSYGFIHLLHTKIPFVWDQQAQEFV